MVESGSGITKAEALANVEAYHQALCDAIKDGNIVVTDLFSIQATISGTFSDFNSSFTKDKNEIKLRLQPGKRLQKLRSKIVTQKKEHQAINPVITKILNGHQNPHPMHDKAGGLLIIKGDQLKINTADDKQGIFFINTNNQQEFKAENLINNKPSELILLIPELTSGQYLIELRVVFHNSKKLRKVQYMNLLLIE